MIIVLLWMACNWPIVKECHAWSASSPARLRPYSKKTPLTASYWSNVDILGRQFNIGTPNSEKETLLQAVHMLNQKIGVIQSSGRIVETDKIVIMAALNLTHDLLKMSAKDGLAIGEIERRISAMIESCDKALDLEK